MNCPALDIAKRKYQCGAGTQKASGSGTTEQQQSLRADRRKAAGAQPDSAGAQIVLNSDAQISLGEIAERALEDPESRVLLEKLLIRLSQADSRFPENWGKYTR